MWIEPWCENFSLKDSFLSLYAICQDKNLRVKGLIVSTTLWNFNWNRNLSQEKSTLEEELKKKLQSIIINTEKVDTWTWGTGIYNVKEPYIIIMENSVDVERLRLVEVWNKFILLKVAIQVWRLFQNRIPSKDNLHKGGVLNGSQTDCSFGCMTIENVSHIF